MPSSKLLILFLPCSKFPRSHQDRPKNLRRLRCSLLQSLKDILFLVKKKMHIHLCVCMCVTMYYVVCMYAYMYVCALRPPQQKNFIPKIMHQHFWEILDQVQNVLKLIVSSSSACCGSEFVTLLFQKTLLSLKSQKRLSPVHHVLGLYIHHLSI